MLLHYSKCLNPIQSAADAYQEAGWRLVRLKPGSKDAYAKGWNQSPQQISNVGNDNIGLAHKFSGTCALDVDDYERATVVLAKHGIDLDALLMAEDAVQIRSGVPNRAKLLYRTSEPLPTHQFKIDGATVYELRCMASNGTTVQDVLPPSIHPDTGYPYEWAGDWQKLPDLPHPLLCFWRSFSPAGEDITHRRGTPSMGNSFCGCSTPSMGNTVLFEGALTEGAFGRLLRDREAQTRMLVWLGFSDFGALYTSGSVKVHSIIGEDKVRSAGLLLSKDGTVLFNDFRGEVGKRPVSLMWLMAFRCGCKLSDVHESHRVSTSTWGVRLMVQSGVIAPAAVDMPPCPDGRESLRQVYDGIRLLFQCRWRYLPHRGEPIMLARHFVAKWCDVTEQQARDGIKDLLKAGVIHTAKQKGTRKYFKPGADKFKR